MIGREKVGGRCFCGAVRFELRFPTDFCSHCHCEDCRRSHGAAFVTWTSVPLTGLSRLAGGARIRRHESHPGVRWHFCGDCGSPLFYDSDEAADRIYITVAALEGPLDREPDSHVSFEEHVAWFSVKDGLARYRGKSSEVLP